MLRLFMNGELFYSFDHSENRSDYYSIYSLKLKKEVNTLSQLSFSIFTTHPKASSLRLKTSTFLLADDDLCLFVGKISSISKDILSRTMEVEVEDFIGCMRDSIMDSDDPYPSSDSTSHVYSYNRVLAKIRERFYTPYDYNSDWKQYKRSGSSSWVGEDFPRIAYSISEMSLGSFEFEDTLIGNDYLSLIYNKVNPWCHGIMTTKAVGYVYRMSNNDIRYYVSSFTLFYSDELYNANSQRDEYDGYLYHKEDLIGSYGEFVYGENLLGINIDSSLSSTISTIFAIGTFKYEDDDEENVITTEVTIPALDSKYGIVSKAIDFGDVGDWYTDSVTPEVELKRKVEAWAENRFRVYCDKMSVKGIDKYFYSESSLSRPIDICDIVLVDAPDFDINGIADYCLSLEIDFFSHENDSYVIGPFVSDDILDYSVGSIYSRGSYDPYNNSKPQNIMSFQRKFTR